MESHEVRTRADLAGFLSDLAERSRSSPQTMPNQTVAEFLDGASGWVADLDGYFRNRREPVPTEPSWTLIAQIVSAALVYE